jgi:hypothetical protein
VRLCEIYKYGLRLSPASHLGVKGSHPCKSTLSLIVSRVTLDLPTAPVIVFTPLRIGPSSWYSNFLRAGRSGDRIPVGARFFAHVQTGPGTHPASCTMGTGSFLGVKWPGRGADQTPPPSAEVKNE